MDLEGRVALVTGGAMRIGRAISIALAEAGCDLFIHYGHSARQAAETASRVESLGQRCETYSADLSDAAQTQSVMEVAVRRYGTIDILVNNAAIFLPGTLADTTEENWSRQFAINLRAPFLLSREFAAQLPADRGGQIINITDARVFRPDSDHFAYRLTKGGLVAMTEGLALDLAPRIAVNAVALGAILPPPGADSSKLDDLVQRSVPLQRAGSPEAVAANVIHILRQDFLTGTTVRLDGGQFI